MIVSLEPRGNRDNLRRDSVQPSAGGGRGSLRGREGWFTSEYLVASLATQDHLNAHGFDLATEEIHRRARSHGGHVIGLQMIYYVWDGVQAFLNREHVFVMHGTQIVSRFPCCDVVRRAF
jgi:hypothetical protein